VPAADLPVVMTERIDYKKCCSSRAKLKTRPGRVSVFNIVFECIPQVGATTFFVSVSYSFSVTLSVRVRVRMLGYVIKHQYNSNIFGRPFSPYAIGPMSCLSVLFVCNVGVLWPNGWMDQDITWYGGTGLGPDDIVVDGDPAPPRKESRQSPYFSAHFALARSPISVTAELLYTMLGYTKGKKVKASHTRYRALGPELIPVYRQSACR